MLPSPDKYEVQSVFLGHRAILIIIIVNQPTYLLLLTYCLCILNWEKNKFLILKKMASLISRLNTHIQV